MATNLIDIFNQSPIEQEPIGPTGLTGGAVADIVGDPFAFGQNVGAVNAEQAFGKLLDDGKAGMIETANTLIAEGSLTEEDLMGLDPNDPSFQSSEGQLAWYETITGKIEKKAQETSRAETGALLAEGKESEAISKEFSSGGLNFEATLQGLQNIKSMEKFEEFLNEQSGVNQKGEAEKGTAEMTDAELKDKKDGLQRKASSISIMQATVQGPASKGAASLARSNQKEIESIDKEISRRLRKEISDDKLTLKREEARKVAQEKFAKGNKTYLVTLNNINELDIALKAFGLEDGIETRNPGNIDLPLAGKAGKKFSRFISKDEGVKVKGLIERIIARDRHDLFGATLTQGENDAFTALTGQKWFSNQKQLLEYLRGIKRESAFIISTGSGRQKSSLAPSIQGSLGGAVAPVSSSDADLLEGFSFEIKD